jgi:hypothetical protein
LFVSIDSEVEHHERLRGACSDKTAQRSNFDHGGVGLRLLTISFHGRIIWIIEIKVIIFDERKVQIAKYDGG